ncbi:MAG: c-type cytochrome [Solirubrobacterales bacterium]
MISARKLGRAAAKPLAVGGVLLGAIALGGCDLNENADLERGRDLFIAKCGTCHVLTEASTTADIGPNLDAAFAAARDSGMDQDTIEGVVQAQIENPRPAEPDQADIYMPANLVTGQDAENVSAYIASVAGIPGIKPPLAAGGEGGQVFANNGCGSCHTMEAAGSSGTAGPNLDDNIPGQKPQDVEESIVDPGAELVQGFENIMPATYGTEIPPEDLKLLVEFLTNCAGDPTAQGCS